MISSLAAIELCQTACLSALFFKKRCQMGSINSLQYLSSKLATESEELLTELATLDDDKLVRELYELGREYSSAAP